MWGRMKVGVVVCSFLFTTIKSQRMGGCGEGGNTLTKHLQQNLLV